MFDVNQLKRAVLGTADFNTPEELLDACVGYFNWVEENPLQEEQLFSYKGGVTRADKTKIRAMSKRAMATYIGMPVAALDKLRERHESFGLVLDMCDQIIYTQKFEGAAANLLNSSLIARDLGLADKSELTGADGGALSVEVEDSARDVILDRLARLAAARGAAGDPS